MDAEDPDTLVPRLGVTAALYAAFGLLPAALLSAGSGVWAYERYSLPSGQHFTPLVDRLGAASIAGVAVTAAAALVPVFLLGVRRVPGRGWRWAAAAVVLTLHLAVVGAAGLVTVGAVLPDALDGERLVDRATEPGGGKTALLYRDKGDCSWSIYLSEPLDPVAHQASRVACRCEHMPEATLGWRAGAPVLLDEAGAAYSCPPPPSGCAHAPGPSGALVALLLLARRRRCAR